MVVVAGSPADKAGIRQGDLIIKFGTVTKVGIRGDCCDVDIFIQDNFHNLKNISDLAESSRNRAVEVTVTRARQASIFS